MPGIGDAIKDPQFQTAPAADQIGYLSSIDPDFAKASKQDQYAYLNHVLAPSRLARSATSTQFEKNRVNESATPVMDTLKGLGEGALQIPATVGKGIQAIPVVGQKIIPSQGLQAEQNLATARTPGEKLGKTEAGVIESSLVPMGKIAEFASPVLKPLARFASENITPALKAIPYVGKGFEAAEGAPTAIRALTRGAATGAATGGVEEGIHTRSLEGAAEGALTGALGGGITGLGLYGLNKYIGPKLASVMSSKPLELTPESAGRETAVKNTFQFPMKEKQPTVSNEPFELQPLAADREPPVQQTLPHVNEPTPQQGKPLNVLENLLKEQGGWQPLEGNVPLREQMRPQPLGADALRTNEGAIPNVAVAQRQLQKPFGNRAAVEVSQVHGPRVVAPGNIPQVIQNAVKEQMGASLTPEEIERQRLQKAYPDAGDRQAIHRTSEKIFEATRDDPVTRKALGDLPAHDNKGGPDLARAAQNLGEDLGQRRIGNKKLMGEGQIHRPEMFDRLLDKGYSPKEILQAAQREPGAASAGGKTLMRAESSNAKRQREAGD